MKKANNVLHNPLRSQSGIMYQLVLLISIAVSGMNIAAADDRPNIVIILADDFGVGDIQAHYPDNKIATPYLDRLVRQGMSFTDAHSPSAVCSPTRYGLLTGRYAWRTRLQEWVIAAYEPPLITSDRPTLPGFLQQHGYRTACIGKWHLGWEWAGPQPSRMTEVRNGQKTLQWDFTKPIRNGPTQRGFDYFYGVDLPNLPPFTFIENDRVVIQPTDQYKLDPDEGVVLPRGFVGAPTAPGWRMQKILPEITRRAVQQIHELAKLDTPFFLYFSMTSPHEPIVPSKDFRGKSGIAPIADFVMETDWSAGQVIKAIDDADIAENTIVIFTGDNGHSHYTGWEKLVDAGHMPSGPYRGHKGDVWEGGHRVPLVVRWPKRVEAGKNSHQLVCLTDIFATCAKIVGADLSAQGAEDSLGFLHSLLGKDSAEGRTTVVNHSNHGEFAYRDGPWKLVFKMAGRNLEQSRSKPTIVELYNLESDIAEKNNLSRKHPEIVKRMTQGLKTLIEQGSSRTGQKSSNDTAVRFDRIQPKRWAPALE
jgi:arylsulfatase A